ncbi:hypothetical protein HAX54_035484 [Datura stramonium]|uniref:Cytochrome P450 n=1 Tax=Datura stramonium TaxID=4076 RepID=A0ABS8VGF7_DATST|nr:hypothetical protein [Datura stramonium]
MRKVCVMELLTAKNVRSFSSIRRDEASRLVQLIRASTRGEPVNVTERVLWYESSITCKAAFGELLKDQEKFIGIVRELVELAGGFSVADIFPSIKILHVLSGLRSRILKVHKNVDAIVEDVINEHKKNIASGKKGNGALGGLVLCWNRNLSNNNNMGHDRNDEEPKRVMVNVWAMGRDPKYWEDAESFMPERFEQNSVDFMGNNFEFLPFGAGRRMCPGISFSLINVYLPLAKLLYHFDWKLPDGVKPEDVDMTEYSAITAARKSELHLIATPYDI